MALRAAASRSWRSGTAVLARRMAPSSRGASQPSISTTLAGATPSTVERSRLSMSAGPNLAPIALHQPRLVPLPVAFGDGLALVVQLLALGEAELQLRQPLVGPVELGRDDRAA